MRVDSTTTRLFDYIINKKPIGTKFSLNEFAVEVKDFSSSDGAISGFLNRAVRYGLLSTERITVKHNRRGILLYTVNNYTNINWKFKKSSKGSTKGRIIHMPKQELETTQQELPFVKSSLADEIMQIAIKVAAIEGKGISQYTDNELLAELKSRIKTNDK